MSNQASIQMKLDFGQKNFKYAHCGQCHMVYNLADAEDRNAHTLHHSRITAPKSKLPRGKHQRILQELFDGSRIVELCLNNRTGLAYFSRISATMAHDLGHDNPQTTPAKDLAPLDTSVPSHWRVFAYVLDGSQLVVGCCVVEELTQDLITSQHYHVRRLSGGRASLLSWRLQSQDRLNCSSPSDLPVNKLPASESFSLPLCGVRRLWVSPKHRRKGVATRLLTCVLSNLCYGHPLTPSLVAFSEPTASGADFAVSFVGREDFITY